MLKFNLFLLLLALLQENVNASKKEMNKKKLYDEYARSKKIIDKDYNKIYKNFDLNSKDIEKYAQKDVDFANKNHQPNEKTFNPKKKELKNRKPLGNSMKAFGNKEAWKFKTKPRFESGLNSSQASTSASSTRNEKKLTPENSPNNSYRQNSKNQKFICTNEEKVQSYPKKTVDDKTETPGRKSWDMSDASPTIKRVGSELKHKTPNSSMKARGNKETWEAKSQLNYSFSDEICENDLNSTQASTKACCTRNEKQLTPGNFPTKGYRALTDTQIQRISNLRTWYPNSVNKKVEDTNEEKVKSYPKQTMDYKTETPDRKAWDMSDTSPTLKRVRSSKSKSKKTNRTAFKM